ncbi:MAG: DUF2798 domain-containing protein [Chitinophagaceae bacterium]|nr:DUF2798 domain-containing protein [Chitinophagaceae bacterium]
MNKSKIKFAFITALVVTSYISFTVVSVNLGFGKYFLFIWFRSWFIAWLLAVPSLLFIAPLIRKKIKNK